MRERRQVLQLEFQFLTVTVVILFYLSNEWIAAVEYLANMRKEKISLPVN